MMKIAAFILFLIVNYADAKNIVVLTSLPIEQAQTTRRLNQIVSKKLNRYKQHDIILVNNANQEDLYKYLNSPETLALLWLSHGGFKKIGSNNSSIKASSLLLDYNGDNVASIFKSIHPNIKFLGVIGCNSSQIISEHIKDNQLFGSYIPNKKVIATWALRKAIRKLRRVIKKNTFNFISKDILGEGYEVEITRKASLEKSKSLRVLVNNKLVGLIPSSSGLKEQKVKVFIPFKEELSSRELNIKFESGQSAFDSTDHFGEINIFSNGQPLWKLFAKRNGEAFGVNTRIFLFDSVSSYLGESTGYIIHKQ